MTKEEKYVAATDWLYDGRVNPETKLYHIAEIYRDEIRDCCSSALWYAFLEWKDKNIDKIQFASNIKERIA